jgi:hypothetical protein
MLVMENLLYDCPVVMYTDIDHKRKRASVPRQWDIGGACFLSTWAAASLATRRLRVSLLSCKTVLCQGA